MRKLSDQTPFGQLMSLLTLLTVLVTLFGSVVLLAADKAIDQVYATDADLQAVQRQVAAQVEEIKQTVNKNTDVSNQTAQSVQALALSIVTIQIRDLEPDIQELEREKRLQGTEWSTAEERTLRQMQRTLMDLEKQRNTLFSTTIGD